MAKPTLPPSNSAKSAYSLNRKVERTSRRSANRRSRENSDVLIAAVISPYLLTHLHHVLQRAEYGAVKEGRSSQAANFAQLRKVLCMDARSMEDASAMGMRDGEGDKLNRTKIRAKVA